MHIVILKEIEKEKLMKKLKKQMAEVFIFLKTVIEFGFLTMRQKDHQSEKIVLE